MFGTRNFLINAQVLDQKTTQNLDIKATNEIKIKDLLRQTKQISKIIAYTWLDKDKDVCKNLDDCFKDPTHQKLKKLLYAEDESSKEYQWLKKVFEDQKGGPHLPIFSPDEIKAEIYEFKVLHDQFEGRITDAAPRAEGPQPLLTMWIPYPPCPQVSDSPNVPGAPVAPIYKGDLEKWITDPLDNNCYYAQNPYIPTTCS